MFSYFSVWLSVLSFFTPESTWYDEVAEKGITVQV